MKLVCGLIIGAFVLAGLGGCGGGDGTDPTASGGDQALTKAEFLKQADAICATANRRRAAAIEAASKEQEVSFEDPGATENLIVVAVVPVLRRMSDELSGLGSPDAKAEAIVNAYRASVQGTAEHPRKFLEKGLQSFAKARSLAGVYGLKVCSTI